MTEMWKRVLQELRPGQRKAWVARSSATLRRAFRDYKEVDDGARLGACFKGRMADHHNLSVVRKVAYAVRLTVKPLSAEGGVYLRHVILCDQPLGAPATPRSCV